MKKRSHKIEKLARVYDDEVLPVWAERFGRMLLRGLNVPDRGQVLDVACGTGYPAIEILRRMGPGCRLIAIDAASAMLDIARKKISEMPEAKGKVFFRSESAEPKLSFADDVYDLVVCNLGLEEMEDPGGALADFARVTAPGGEVRCTLPLEGTFQEFFDMYREVLIKHDKHEALDRLNEHLRRYPSVEECERWMAGAGFSKFQVHRQEFSMLFKSSREFFFAPVIEYGPLAEWKAIAGKGQEMQDVFWYIKEAIDAYFGERAFQVSVVAGCLIGRVGDVGEEDETGRVERLGDDLVPDAAVLAEEPAEPAPLPPLEPAEPPPEMLPPEELALPGESGGGTEEISIDEIEELETLNNAEPVIDDEVIEAFQEGARRPPHLDEE